jgi:hypothetical protein
VFDEGRGDDCRHALIRVVPSLSAVEAQRERQRVGKVFGAWLA